MGSLGIGERAFVWGRWDGVVLGKRWRGRRG